MQLIRENCVIANHDDDEALDRRSTGAHLAREGVGRFFLVAVICPTHLGRENRDSLSTNPGT